MALLDNETAKEAALDLYESKSELGYQVKRGGAKFLVKRTVDLVGGTLEMLASSISTMITGTIGALLRYTVGPELARDLGAFAGAIGGKLAGFIGIGFAAGISAAFTQMDYVHEKNNIKNTYKNAIGKQLGKAPDDVTMKDVYAASEDNSILKEELDRARRKRNFNVPVAIVTTLASFAAVTMLLPMVLAAVGAPTAAAVGVTGFAIKAITSIATYFAVKTPLKSVGDKVFGLSKHTSCDHIHKIAKSQSRDKAIEPEQVVGLLACADQSIAHAITQAHGKPYEELSKEQQKQSVQQLSTQLPVEQLTQALNEKSIHAAELILWPEKTRQKLLSAMQEKNSAALDERQPEGKKTHVERLREQSQAHDGPQLA